MPEPTVTVRMKEIATFSLDARQTRAPVASSRALILATALERKP